MCGNDAYVLDYITLVFELTKVYVCQLPIDHTRKFVMSLPLKINLTTLTIWFLVRNKRELENTLPRYYCRKKIISDHTIHNTPILLHFVCVICTGVCVCVCVCVYVCVYMCVCC